MTIVNRYEADAEKWEAVVAQTPEELTTRDLVQIRDTSRKRSEETGQIPIEPGRYIGTCDRGGRPSFLMRGGEHIRVRMVHYVRMDDPNFIEFSGGATKTITRENDTEYMCADILLQEVGL